MLNFFNTSTIKLNLLGLLNLSFNGRGFSPVSLILIGVGLAIVNFMVYAALMFWAIGVLFHFSIPFTLETVLAVGALLIILKGND